MRQYSEATLENGQLEEFIKSILAHEGFQQSRQKILEHTGGVLPRARLMAEFYTHEDWFCNLGRSEEHDAIHMHRVFFWQETLRTAIEHQTGESIDPEPTRYAAIMHDIARNGDNEDPGHGARAAEIIPALLPNVDINSQLVATIQRIVRDHDRDDADVKSFDKDLYWQILKDADGLEYTRSEVDIINPAFFRLMQTPHYILAAYALSQLSHQYYIRSRTPEERRYAVIKSGIQLGLIEDDGALDFSGASSISSI